jgi:hypothetical protein
MKPIALPAVLATLLTSIAFAQDQPAPPDITKFTNVTRGQYQVFADTDTLTATEVNGFMNQMLAQYSRYFSNWALKDGARIVVFANGDDFRAYADELTGMPTHSGLAGYCHLKTDEDGNTFYELVTFVHDNLWQVLAHEGFHQFLGYELGSQVPVWLNEGLAQYFETSYVQFGKLRTGIINARKLRAAQALIRSRKAPSIGELLAMDRDTFYSNGQVTYPTSWALVYYLITRDGSTYSSSRFRRYLQDLKLNQNQLLSFQRRFGRDGFQWQSDFERYVLNLQPSEQ